MPDVNLSNTTWVLNSTLNPFSVGNILAYTINVIFPNAGEMHSTEYHTANGLRYLNNSTNNKLAYFCYDCDTSMFIYDNGTWYNENYRTIKIIDGADVENGNLADWLNTNAVQQIEPSPSQNVGKILIGTKQVKKVYIGTKKVKKVYIGTKLTYNDDN